MQGVKEEQGAQRQLTSSKGPGEWEFATMNKGSHFQVKVFHFFLL